MLAEHGRVDPVGQVAQLGQPLAQLLGGLGDERLGGACRGPAPRRASASATRARAAAGRRRAGRARSRRRAASPASTIRTRDARSSSVRACSISCRRSASSAARRSVMSNIAPSTHSRPPGPGTIWPRSSTQRSSPSARTIRYSMAKARSCSAACSTARIEPVAVVGMDDAEHRAPRAGDEVGRQVARDALDLVADELDHVAGVPRRAIDGAGHVEHQRAHQPVIGALARRAQPGAGAREQLAARERPVQVVVGAGGERGVRSGALGRDGQHPRPVEARIGVQRAAEVGRCRGRRGRGRR